MDVRLRHPATFMVAGPTMVGKSYMVRDLIRKRQEIFTAPIDVVIWCYGCYQPLYDSFKDEGIHLHEGPISPTELQPNTSYLIIFDDLMQENNQGITDFFYSRRASPERKRDIHRSKHVSSRERSSDDQLELSLYVHLQKSS